MKTLIEKILYKFWFINIEKTIIFIDKYNQNILNWAKEDFWVEKSIDENTLLAYNSYINWSLDKDIKFIKNNYK